MENQGVAKRHERGQDNQRNMLPPKSSRRGRDSSDAKNDTPESNRGWLRRAKRKRCSSHHHKKKDCRNTVCWRCRRACHFAASEFKTTSQTKNRRPYLIWNSVPRTMSAFSAATSGSLTVAVISLM